MDWYSVYLMPQALSKYIYLSSPLIFPTTSTELGQKTTRCESLRALLHYVEWGRIVILAGAKADWGLRYHIYFNASFFLLVFVFVAYFVFLPHQNHRNYHHFAVTIVNLTLSFNFSNFIFISLRISIEQICTSSTWCNHKLDILILGWSWIIIFVSLSISEAENSNIFFSKTTCIMFCYIAMRVEMFHFGL